MRNGHRKETRAGAKDALKIGLRSELGTRNRIRDKRETEDPRDDKEVLRPREFWQGQVAVELGQESQLKRDQRFGRKTGKRRDQKLNLGRSLNENLSQDRSCSLV